MTCIVGLETKKGVIMGGDSASTSNHDTNATRLKKVFKRGPFLIGYTWSFRMGQLLQYQLVVDKESKKQSDLEYLSTTFIDAIRKCFSTGGFKTVQNEEETGGQFLVGYKKQLYMIGSDFQVNSRLDGFNAVGYGMYYALGSMRRTKALAPKKRVKLALKDAGHFSGAVCGPYHILRINND